MKANINKFDDLKMKSSRFDKLKESGLKIY